MLLWWAHRHPGIKRLIAKLDVDAAFRRIWVALVDAGLFATELPGHTEGIEGYIGGLFVAMSFGWNGAPGEYATFGEVQKQAYEALEVEDQD